jgi:hyaluronan synthase/N-acetylglucosaminyltransferase
MLNGFIFTYAVLILLYTSMQIFFAQKNSGKQNTFKLNNDGIESDLSVTVVIPCYNENPQLLESCLQSINNQKISGKLNTIVIDDGSRNIEELLPVLNTYKAMPNFDVYIFEKNKGKRMAQKLGFDKATGDIIVTIDSDTIIDPVNGINIMLKQFKNQDVGAITGDIKVLNKNDNFLTKLILYRYWLAFNQERAAQSNFDAVMCCSGPFSAYRRSIIEKVKDQYISQTFLGHVSTYGDDRHLTNLILQDNHIVRFEKNAIAYTHVPSSIKTYVKQQIRWNKSFYRELLWTLKNVPTKHFYMTYDMIMQLILPYISIVATIGIVYAALFISLKTALIWVILLSTVTVLKSTHGAYRTRELGFFLFLTYGFVHTIFLVPSRFYAILTLKENGWSTR